MNLSNWLPVLAIGGLLLLAIRSSRGDRDATSVLVGLGAIVMVGLALALLAVLGFLTFVAYAVGI